MWLAEHAAEVECCYLTTTGRRSGQPHEIEIWFGVIGASLYLISGNGPTAHWYLNLVADPRGVGADRGRDRGPGARGLSTIRTSGVGSVT